MNIDDRMKKYEHVSRIYLTRRMPIIIRIDGKAFHNFTKGMHRPFDDLLIRSMQDTAKYLCENISGCKIAYTQSDEISLLLIDYDNINTEAWFNNNLQKLVSVAASMATMAFNQAFRRNRDEYAESCNYFQTFDLEADYLETLYNKLGQAMFDARAFILPKEEVCNYFIWRQQDATRNSIQMVAQSMFSHKELQHKNTNELQEMLFQKGINWNNYKTIYKRGSCIVRIEYPSLNIVLKTHAHTEVTRKHWSIDMNIPIFTQDRNYIEQYVYPEGN